MSTTRTVDGPRKDGNLIIEDVWYEGDDDVLQGEAVCYNVDYNSAEATEYDGRRGNHVERPSLTNIKNFAGVALRTYKGRSGGTRIRIAAPGSKGALVALGGVDTVLGAGILAFTAGADGDHRGRFYTGRYRGRGAAIPRQTATGIVYSNYEGGWSLSTDGLTLTVPPNHDGVIVGDTVVVVGGQTLAAGGNVVPGKYTVAALPTNSTITLDRSAVENSPAGVLETSGYIYTGNPVVQADLLDGPGECGGVDFVSLPDAGGDIQETTACGLSYVLGHANLAGNVDLQWVTDGTDIYGDVKGWSLAGDLTGGDFQVELVQNGLQRDGSTVLTFFLGLDAQNDAAAMIYNGVKWQTLDIFGVGVTESAV